MKVKKIMYYLRGINIGIILEYAIRIEFGYIQGFILAAFLVMMGIDLATED